MEYVRLGETGLEVSQLCLGTWWLGKDGKDGGDAGNGGDGRNGKYSDAAVDLLDAAWDRGINFIDTANVYSGGTSEKLIGEWLASYDRENFVIASKVYYATRGRRDAGLSRKIVMAELEATLERLGTDYLDIYYIHGWHEPSPLEETLSAFNDLVRSGRVRYLGVSNFAAWQLVKSNWIADANGWESISVIQPRYNAVDHFPYTDDPDPTPLPELFDACRDMGVGVCAFGPLAGGFLTGKYDRGSDGNVLGPDGSRADVSDTFGPFSDRAWAVLEAVREVAAEVDASPAQVALAWAMSVDDLACIPIFGARSLEQLDENVDSLSVSLSDEQYERIAQAGGGVEFGSWPVYS